MLKALKSCNYPKEQTSLSWINEQIKDRQGFTVVNPKCHPVIFLKNKPIKPEDIGTLAHEATHAVNWIFQSIQEAQGEEFYAHSVGAIVRIVLSGNKI